MVRYITIGFLTNFIICVLTFVSYFIIEQNDLMPSKTCMLLGLTVKSFTITCITVMVDLLQIESCISVKVSYSIIIKELKNSEYVQSSKTQDKSVSKQALLIILSNILCWLPSSIISMVSLIAEAHPIELLTWNVVLVNPINFVMTPIIYFVLPKVKNWIKTHGSTPDRKYNHGKLFL